VLHSQTNLSIGPQLPVYAQQRECGESFELPDDDSEFLSRSKGSSKSSHGKARAIPYVVPIHVPGPVTTGQRASHRQPCQGPCVRRSTGSGSLRREARIVPQGGRYMSMSPELEAVGGSVHTASALSYFPPSVAGPSDPSLPSSYVPNPSLSLLIWP